MTNNKYNLEERTAKFGESVILFCQGLPKTEITRPLITQLVKCGTSVGANYCEADDAESKQDFNHKIGISKKESRETKHPKDQKYQHYYTSLDYNLQNQKVPTETRKEIQKK